MTSTQMTLVPVAALEFTTDTMAQMSRARTISPKMPV